MSNPLNLDPRALRDPEVLAMLAELDRRDECRKYEDSLEEFVKAAWPTLEPGGRYMNSWAVSAICEHLQAVTEGHIRRLVINISPRSLKSVCASICWPAWTWARRQISTTSGPQVRWLCASYNDDLSLDFSTKRRRLITSPWYQSLWGTRFSLTGDQNTKHKFDNDKGGRSAATSVKGTLLGIGGDCLLGDDLHNLEQVESDSERLRAINFWKEFTTTRLNNPEESAIVLIMQRLHSNDLAGYWLDQDRDGAVTACIIPMEYDAGRHCTTVLKWDYVENDAGEIEAVPLKQWSDPRTVDGELMHPERVGREQLELMKRELGPTMASGRLQQAPVPSGGGIFNINDWQPWPPEGYPMKKPRKGEDPSIDLPPVEFVLASLDTALDSKKENDYHALTIWGVWKAVGAGMNDPISRMVPNAWSHRLQAEPWLLHNMTPEQWSIVEQMKVMPAEEDRPKAVLMYAWHKRLGLHGPPEQRPDGLTDSQWNSPEMRKERGKQWGLVEWVVDSCRRYGVNRLLIEATASGFAVSQELNRLFSNQGMVVELVGASGKGDKVARAYSVQHLFTDRLVYAPFFPDTGEPILWLRTVLDELSSFPKGKHDDIVDSCVHALRWLRDHGLISRREEFEEGWLRERQHQGKSIPLYPM